MPLNFDDIVPQGGALPPGFVSNGPGRLNFDDIVPQKPGRLNFDDIVPQSGTGDLRAGRRAASTPATSPSQAASAC